MTGAIPSNGDIVYTSALPMPLTAFSLYRHSRRARSFHPTTLLPTTAIEHYTPVVCVRTGLRDTISLERRYGQAYVLRFTVCESSALTIKSLTTSYSIDATTSQEQDALLGDHWRRSGDRGKSCCRTILLHSNQSTDRLRSAPVRVCPQAFSRRR